MYKLKIILMNVNLIKKAIQIFNILKRYKN